MFSKGKPSQSFCAHVRRRFPYSSCATCPRGPSLRVGICLAFFRRLHTSVLYSEIPFDTVTCYAWFTFLKRFVSISVLCWVDSTNIRPPRHLEVARGLTNRDDGVVDVDEVFWGWWGGRVGWRAVRMAFEYVRTYNFNGEKKNDKNNLYVRRDASVLWKFRDRVGCIVIKKKLLRSPCTNAVSPRCRAVNNIIAASGARMNK